VDRDRTSGSTDILDDAIRSIRRRLESAGLRGVSGTLDALEARYPSMALLLNLAAFLREAVPEGPEALIDRLETFGRDLERERAEVAERFRLLAERQRWRSAATYSRSGQVGECLAAASAAGLRRVLLSEARPAMEGILFAEELENAGFEVVLTADAALPSLLPEADALVVGADAVTGEGFVNKVGTGMLLREARRLGIPTVILAVSRKRLGTAQLEAWRNTPLDRPGEAVPFAWRGETFESLPWDLVVHALCGPAGS